RGASCAASRLNTREAAFAQAALRSLKHIHKSAPFGFARCAGRMKGRPSLSTCTGERAIDLFHDLHQANLRRAQPLAARMRPRSLDDFVGQEHFLGPGKLLRRMLLADRLSSVIFYGPPGTGKTALAHVIANHTRSA